MFSFFEPALVWKIAAALVMKSVFQCLFVIIEPVLINLLGNCIIISFRFMRLHSYSSYL